MKGPDVVALWGVGNAVLLGILIGFGETLLPVLLYAGSVALIELIALVSWQVLARRPEWAATSPALQRSRVSLLAAVGVGFIGAGFIWRPWMFLPVVYPALMLSAEAVGSVRRRATAR